MGQRDNIGGDNGNNIVILSTTGRHYIFFPTVPEMWWTTEMQYMLEPVEKYTVAFF